MSGEEEGGGVLDQAPSSDTGDHNKSDSGGEDLDIDTILSRSRPLTTRRRKNLYEAPEFVKRLNPYEEAEAGSSVIFECQWKAFPRPMIKWYKDDEEITDGDSRYQFGEGEKGITTLVIVEAKKGDEGAFRCKAENQEGVASTTGYLTVIGDDPDKTLAAQHRKNEEVKVSLPPHLRTIREQKTLEETEEEEYDNMSPSPIRAFIDDVVAHKGNFPWPPGTSSPGQREEDEESSGSDTSVDSQDFSHVAYEVSQERDLIDDENTEQPQDTEQQNTGGDESGQQEMDTPTPEQTLVFPASEAQRLTLPRPDIITDIEDKGENKMLSNHDRLPSPKAFSMFTTVVDDDVAFSYDDVKVTDDATPRPDDVSTEVAPDVVESKIVETQSAVAASAPAAPITESLTTQEPITPALTKTELSAESSTVPKMAAQIVAETPVKSIVRQPSLPTEELNFPWLFFFALTTCSTFAASALDLPPSVLILFVMAVSFISFRTLVTYTPKA